MQTGALQFIADQREQFGGARLHNFAKHPGKYRPWRAVADASHLDGRVAEQHLVIRAGIFALDFFSLGNRRAQADSQIVCEMVAANRNCRRVAGHPAGIDEQFRGASADVQQAAAQIVLILQKAGFGRGERFQHSIADHDARAVHCGNQILRRGSGRSDYMNIDFQPLAHHSHRVADAVLGVHQKFLRKDVKHLAVIGQRDAASRINRAANVVALDVTRMVAQRNAAAAVQPAHVISGNTDERRFHGYAREAFGFFERPPNRTDRGIEVDDEALARTLRFSRAQGQEFHPVVFHLADQRARLRAADIQGHDVAVLPGHRSAPLFPGEISPKRESLHLLAFVSGARAPDVSGFTTTWRAKRRSTDSTRPALACHCANLSARMRYLLAKSPSPKCTSTVCLLPAAPERPVKTARKSPASERSASLTRSPDPGRTRSISFMNCANMRMRCSRSSRGWFSLIPLTTGK